MAGPDAAGTGDPMFADPLLGGPGDGGEPWHGGWPGSGDPVGPLPEGLPGPMGASPLADGPCGGGPGGGGPWGGGPGWLRSVGGGGRTPMRVFEDGMARELGPPQWDSDADGVPDTVRVAPEPDRGRLADPRSWIRGGEVSAEGSDAPGGGSVPTVLYSDTDDNGWADVRTEIYDSGTVRVYQQDADGVWRPEREQHLGVDTDGG